MVSWAVQRQESMDLLTVGNTTFTGDNRFAVVFQNPTDWVLRYSVTRLSDPDWQGSALWETS